MRKYTWLLVLGTAAAIFAAQSGGLLSNFSKLLGDAQGLKASFQAGPIGGTMDNFEVALAKPNMARIDTPTQTIIADGKTVLTYDKSTKTYYKDPQDAGTLAGLMQDEALNIWAPFFNAKALDKVSTKSLGTKNRKGVTYNVVEATFNGGKKKVSYYLDSAGIARMADIGYTDSDKGTVIITKSVELGNADASLFAFNAPAGSRELTEEERSSNKWYTNLDMALDAAKKLNKLVLVDFDATWCGPCQRLKAEVYSTDTFKAFGKQFVFCEIDIDDNPALASTYKATAIPAVHFLKADGTDIHNFVGYSNPDQVFGEMRTALAKAGR